MNITFPDNRANAKLGPPSRSRGGQKTPEELKVLGDKILKRDKCVQSGHLEHPIRFYPNGFSVILSLPLLLYKSVRPSVKVECIFRIDSSPGFSMIL